MVTMVKVKKSILIRKGNWTQECKQFLARHIENWQLEVQIRWSDQAKVNSECTKERESSGNGDFGNTQLMKTGLNVLYCRKDEF